MFDIYDDADMAVLMNDDGGLESGKAGANNHLNGETFKELDRFLTIGFHSHSRILVN